MKVTVSTAASVLVLSPSLADFAFCPFSALSGGAIVCLLFGFSSKLKKVWKHPSRSSRDYK